MNSTFSQGEQAVISLTGLLFCPIICIVLFYIAVYRRQIKDSETLESKAHLFYRMTSGIILGQVLNFTIWSVQLVPLFVCTGYFVLEIIDAYITPPGWKAELSQNLGLNKKTMEKETIYAFDDLTDPNFGKKQTEIKLDTIDNRRRQFMLWITLFSFTLICISNGFHLVSGNFPVSKLATLLCYVANAIAMTIAVCSCMIHAHYHVTEQHRRRVLWWSGVSFIWCVLIVFCGSAIIVLTNVVEPSLANAVIQSNAFTGIFGVSSGLLLRIHEYFHHNTKSSKGVDTKDVTMGLLVFALALAQSVIMSFYF